MMTSRLTTVILSRDMDTLLRFCLIHLDAAATAANLPAREIVIVDNASVRHLPAALDGAPAYRRLRLDAHAGFGAACNRGAALAPADFYLFLNNDVLLADGALSAMMAEMAADPGLGICGCRLMFPDGTIQHAGVLMAGPPGGPYHVGRRQPPRAVPVTRTDFQAVTGACALVRRETFAAIGGFDETFTFGYEDVDLCLRARQAGWRVRCVQSPESLHFESMTPGRQELGAPTLGQFFERWLGRYTIDG